MVVNSCGRRLLRASWKGFLVAGPDVFFLACGGVPAGWFLKLNGAQLDEIVLHEVLVVRFDIVHSKKQLSSMK